MMREKIIVSAYNDVRMYEELAKNRGINIEEVVANKEYEKIPVIEKNTVISHDSIISAPYIMSYYRNELMHTRTSGSTGKYMDIYWDPKDYNKSMLPLWLLRRKYYGISAKDRMCYFYSMVQLTEQSDVVQQDNVLGFSKLNLTNEKVKGIYDQMLEFKPRWLMLQPSIAMLLCKCMDLYSLPKLESVTYIEMTGEMLTEQVKNEIKKHFDCDVANQYGAYEFNSIAYECPCGNMHVMDTNVQVEIVDDDRNIVETEKEGHVCITTLTNKAMPLVRYLVGDYGILKDIRCSCGSKRPVLELTSGRTGSWIEGTDGTRISAYELINAVDRLNYLVSGMIKQFTIKQVDYDAFVVKLVVDDEMSEMEKESVPEQFRESIKNEQLKSANYEFEYYDVFFPDNRTGKVSCFVNRIGK